MQTRTAYCSFCRKSYREVGPLVEGPGDVYICGPCIELCQSIIVQEKRRRAHPGGQPPRPTPEAVRGKLDQIIPGADEAKAVLIQAALRHYDGAGGPSAVLLTGPAPSSRSFLARALAFAIDVPFAAGNGPTLGGPAAADGTTLLYPLLVASDFDPEVAQRGIVYVEGADQRVTQEWLVRLWARGDTGPVSLVMDVTRPLYVCGGEFAGLTGSVIREAFQVPGGEPDFVRCLRGAASVPALGEEALGHILAWVDFDRMTGGT